MSAPDTPRITPLPPREWSQEARDSLAALQPPDAKHEIRRAEGAPKALNALGTFARHPRLAHAFHTFNGHILATTTLTLRHRDGRVEQIVAGGAEPYRAMIEHFADVVRGRAAARRSAEDSIATLAVLDQLRAAAGMTAGV